MRFRIVLLASMLVTAAGARAQAAFHCPIPNEDLAAGQQAVAIAAKLDELGQLGDCRIQVSCETLGAGTETEETRISITATSDAEPGFFGDSEVLVSANGVSGDLGGKAQLAPTRLKVDDIVATFDLSHTYHDKLDVQLRQDGSVYKLIFSETKVGLLFGFETTLSSHTCR